MSQVSGHLDVFENDGYKVPSAGTQEGAVHEFGDIPGEHRPRSTFVQGVVQRFRTFVDWRTWIEDTLPIHKTVHPDPDSRRRVLDVPMCKVSRRLRILQAVMAILPLLNLPAQVNLGQVSQIGRFLRRRKAALAIESVNPIMIYSA
ncbi:hypothetical protein PENSUB_13421 [Penicillium subrubescens]|uniref:Uncharacterized protein n=1 Tax=Penicillium subrubescens TaxID=1316194 RepID=A0A1Q5SQK7_9EURO|nr:hypothetical protein PENSUB_13421 [Penicillium subrubescens]